MRRWDRWWNVANKERFFAFFVIGTLTIIVFSMVAYSTVFGQNIGEDLDFIQGEGNALKESVGSWFGTLFSAIGALSLFAASIGIADYVSRLVADVLKVGYLRESKRWSESRIYSCVVWTIAVFSIASRSSTASSSSSSSSEMARLATRVLVALIVWAVLLALAAAAGLPSS